MSTPNSPKAIISVGLGKYASQDPNGVARFGPGAGETARALLKKSIEEAAAAGFKILDCDANTQDYDDTMKRFNETMRSEDFIGINVGFGLRGHKEHTALLEKILNTSLEIRPGIKIMFSNGPDAIVPAIQRAFPEAF